MDVLMQATGKKGSLESYASATGVRLTAIEFLEKSKKPSLLRKSSCRHAGFKSSV
jgi:glucokinase